MVHLFAVHRPALDKIRFETPVEIPGPKRNAVELEVSLRSKHFKHFIYCFLNAGRSALAPLYVERSVIPFGSLAVPLRGDLQRKLVADWFTLAVYAVDSQ